MNEFNLKNKIIILTGSEGLLAQSFIQSIIKFNGKLILIDKKQRYKRNNKNLTFYKCNLTSEINVKKTFLKIYKKFGTPDVLINNAALNPTPKEIKKHQRGTN